MATELTPSPEKEGKTTGNNQTQGWTQSDKAIHTPMWQLGIKHPSALAVLHFMISKLTRGSNGVIISAAALSRQMGVSLRTAQTAVSTLQQRQFVQVLKSGNTNAYIINSKVAWQGKRGMRHASFNAQILVDEAEQLRSVDELIAEGAELLEVPLMSMFEQEGDVYDMPPSPSERKKQKKEQEQGGQLELDNT